MMLPKMYLLDTSVGGGLGMIGQYLGFRDEWWSH